MKNATCAVAVMFAFAVASFCVAQTAPTPLPPNQIPTNIPQVTAIAAPPQGFDPLAASDQDLAYWGFPPRPDQGAHPKEYARWEQLVTTPTTRIVPILKETGIYHGPVRELKQASPPTGLPVVEGSLAPANTTWYDSLNWSGFVAQNGSSGNTFSAVVLGFYVPSAYQAFGTCTSSPDYGTTWTGIDGYTNADVLQAGVTYISSGTNFGDGLCAYTETFYPWYEWYPYPEVQITNMGANAGDYYFVEVTGTAGSSQGNVYVYDYSTDVSVSLLVNAPSGITLAGNSAEWIIERPEVGGSLTTLVNYVNDALWNGQAAYGPLEAFPTQSTPINMVDSNDNVISTPWDWISNQTFLMETAGPARY
jgi:hypothetical protein